MLSPHCPFKVLSDLELPSDLLQSYQELVADPYCAGRYRRFSQYRMQADRGRWKFLKLPHRPLIQPRQYNSFVGGVLRELEPILFDLTPLIGIIAGELGLEAGCDWQIDVHQWRTTTCSSPTSSVPEGPHQDGHQYGAVIVVSRSKVCGGHTILYRTTDRAPFFRVTLDAGEAILFDDRALLHYTTDVHTRGFEGHRDIVVLDFNEWQDRRYGEEFEELALASTGEAPVVRKSHV